MTDEHPPLEDDELAALLRRVSEDATLQPRHRERARAAMFAEFDAIVADADRADTARADGADSGRLPPVVPAIELDDGSRRRSTSGSRSAGWAAAAAAVVFVLALVVTANVRDDPATSDTVDPTPVTSPDTLPGVEDPPEPLSAESVGSSLDEATYETDAIGGGITFSNADGLQLVALRPGLLVLDSVSAGGDLRGRVSVFEADEAAIADVIEAAVDDGDLQITEAQFTGGDQPLRRRDLTVTGAGIADLGCVGQDGCLPLVAGDDELDPSVWPRSENFLVEARSGEPSIFVFVQTKTFGDPLLNQAFDIIDSLRLE
jgi:hypothetical protein